MSTNFHKGFFLLIFHSVRSSILKMSFESSKVKWGVVGVRHVFSPLNLYKNIIH